jgi:hypothetical protein
MTYKQRLTKPDGRALNLYARAPFPPAASEQAPVPAGVFSADARPEDEAREPQEIHVDAG